jgi:hypothetical protein
VTSSQIWLIPLETNLKKKNSWFHTPTSFIIGIYVHVSASVFFGEISHGSPKNKIQWDVCKWFFLEKRQKVRHILREKKVKSRHI